MSRPHFKTFTLFIYIFFFISPATAQMSNAPHFVPDFVFAGSELNEWRMIGKAEWQAEDGVISGKADAGPGLVRTAANGLWRDLV